MSYPVDTRALAAATRRPSIKGLKIAWSADLGVTPVDDEVRRVASASVRVFRSLGATVDEAHPELDGLFEIVQTTRGASMVARHESKLETWRPVMQDNLVKNIEYGLTLTASDIGRAERLRTELWHRLRAFYDRYDLIITPTAAVEPFPVEQSYPREINGKVMENYIQWVMLTYAFTVAGVPAISVPCGFSRSGLPVGLQIAGRWRDEVGVLRAAAAFEQAAPWAGRRPPDPV